MTAKELKRKLAAILSADVKGYSRLMGEDEEGTIRTLNYEKLHLLNGALNCLASVSASIGDLHKAKRMLKVLRLMNSTEDFKDQPEVW